MSAAIAGTERVRVAVDGLAHHLRIGEVSRTVASTTMTTLVLQSAAGLVQGDLHGVELVLHGRALLLVGGLMQ